jgi:hypothetical protein
MTYEFPAAVEVLPVFATGALDALRRGDAAEHDRLVAQAAAEVQVELFALAQFSISRAATILAASTGKRVLTTPDSAVRELRRAMHDGHE